MNKGILVLGMHRSGTSTIAGILSKFGVNLGNSLIKPQKNVNEKGFFEDAHILDLNNRILCHKASYWDDFYPRQTNDKEDKKINTLTQKAVSYLHRELNQGVWAIKEPRMSVLMRFWHRTFTKAEMPYAVLFIFRHPEEVFLSLNKRDNFSREKAYLLWLKYNLYAENDTRNNQRYFMEYSDIFGDLEDAIAEMQIHMGITFPLSYHQAKPEIDKFVTKKLRNNRVDENITIENEQSDAIKLGLEVYEALRTIASIDKRRQITLFDDFNQQYNAVFNALPNFVIEHHREASRERGRYENLFLESYNTLWWSMASPFRWLEKKLRKLED